LMENLVHNLTQKMCFYEILSYLFKFFCKINEIRYKYPRRAPWSITVFRDSNFILS
jgi:hypothetical protein